MKIPPTVSSHFIHKPSLSTTRKRDRDLTKPPIRPNQLKKMTPICPMTFLEIVQSLGPMCAADKKITGNDVAYFKALYSCLLDVVVGWR